MMYMLHATETGSFGHTQLTIQLSHSNVLQAKRAMGGLGHPRLHMAHRSRLEADPMLNCGWPDTRVPTRIVRVYPTMAFQMLG